MDPRRISDAVEVLNWLATRIQEMPDRGRDTVESGVILALSSVCLSEYVHLLAQGEEAYDALKSSADGMTAYRRKLLKNWAPLSPETELS